MFTFNRICPECKTAFSTESNVQKTCSPQCAKIRKNRLMKEYKNNPDVKKRYADRARERWKTEPEYQEKQKKANKNWQENKKLNN